MSDKIGLNGASFQLLNTSTFKYLCSFATIGAILTACAAPQVKPEKKTRSKEYFAESVYGVKASPKVSKGKKIRRGGGRNQVGKPYKVKDKWYHPKEEPGYAKTGRASWYGSAFHGRLTANGEVYDMTHLTAAHPTMPLPSYARVTNTSNGNTLIVRVNDRGPFASNRVIDLSQKAAEMLAYKDEGTAKVKVEYIGRAPLEGHDDEYLMASYRSGSDPVGEPATGVMMAMNTPVPDVGGESGALALQADKPVPAPFSFDQAAMPTGENTPELPSQVPVPFEKPAFAYDLAYQINLEDNAIDTIISAYADQRIAQANHVNHTYSKILMPDPSTDSWRQLQKSAAQRVSLESDQGEYVDIGTFTDAAETDRIIAALSPMGKVSRSVTPQNNGALYTLSAKAHQNGENDLLLQSAWANGAEDAFIVRDN